MFVFLKGCPGWWTNTGSFDFVYFLIPSLYRWATAAPQFAHVLTLNWVLFRCFLLLFFQQKIHVWFFCLSQLHLKHFLAPKHSLENALQRFLTTQLFHLYAETVSTDDCVVAQGCQMLYVKTKNLGKFWRALEWTKVGIFYGHLKYILRPFGIFYGNLVYFSPFWYIVSRKI
jgi:hypothetical protein